MKAMVLCAGYGTRLGDMTRDLPKPMLPVNGRPLLEYVLANLARNGCTDLVLNLHFQPQVIRDYFGDGSRFGVRITYSYEAELLGTAGAVRQVASLFADQEAFLVHYGDVVTDQDLTALVESRRRQRAVGVLLVHQRAASNSVVCVEPDGRISRLLERPNAVERQGVTSPWVNSGVYLLTPDAIPHIPAAGPADFPRDVFPALVASGRLWSVPLSGYRCAVDSPERLAALQAAVVSGACHIPLAPSPSPAGGTPV